MTAAVRERARRAVAATTTSTLIAVRSIFHTRVWSMHRTAITGKRFGLLVASSVVATSAILASAMTGAGGSGALAALLGRSLASGNTPVASAPPATPRPAPNAPSTEPQAGSPAAEPSYSAAPAPATPPATPPASEPTTEKPARTPTEPTPEVGPVKHVFVISLTSPGYELSLGAQSQMPYLSATLRPKGELLSNYSLLNETALPNGIAAISGQSPNAATSASCPGYEEFGSAQANSRGVLSGAGCVYPVETLTVADQLTLAHFTWRAYVEGMVDEAGKPTNCAHPNPGEPSTAAQPGGYAASQNPFTYFHSLLDLGDCSANDVPIEQLSKDLGKADKAPAYLFIAPTPCDSGSSAQCAPGTTEGAAAADAFLSTWVPMILASPAYKTGGLLVIAFSAINQSSPGAPAAPTDPLLTGALLLSPFVTPGTTDATPYNPYSLLRASEDLFGLSPLGRAGATKTKSFATSLLEANGGD